MIIYRSIITGTVCHALNHKSVGITRISQNSVKRKLQVNLFHIQYKIVVRYILSNMAFKS